MAFSRWLRFLLKKLYHQDTLPVSVDNGHASDIIQGIPWPIDILLEGVNDREMFPHESTVAKLDDSSNPHHEDREHNTSSRKYHKLCVWKVESFSIEIVEEDVLGMEKGT